MRATSPRLLQPAPPSRRLVFPRMLSSKSISSLLSDRFFLHKNKKRPSHFLRHGGFFSLISFVFPLHYGPAALSTASDTAKYVAIAATPIPTIRNRLRPAFIGDPPLPPGPSPPPASPCPS